MKNISNKTSRYKQLNKVVDLVNSFFFCKIVISMVSKIITTNKVLKSLEKKCNLI